jgi:hypothetical protein
VTNEETAFREVDQALAEEQQWMFLRRRGPLLIAGASVIVLGVAGWQIYNAQRESRAGKQAVAFHEAVEQLRADAGAGRESLAKLSEGSGGYAALAEMMRAGALAASGEREEALKAYRGVYQGGAAKRLKQLARLRAATLAMEDGRDAVLSDLGDLTEDGSPMGAYARELAALAAFEAKDYETAHAMFAKASTDEGAPEPVRQRAKEFAALALAAKSGVNVAGAVRAEDLMRALEQPGGAHDHDHDHDHAEEGADPAPDANAPQQE